MAIQAHFMGAATLLVSVSSNRGSLSQCLVLFFGRLFHFSYVCSSSDRDRIGDGDDNFLIFGGFNMVLREGDGWDWCSDHITDDITMGWTSMRVCEL